MREIYSDCLTSDTRREGLKQISISIQNLLLNNKDLTYKEILENIISSNPNTLRRRVYDVLSVMKALNLIIKEKKVYNLVNRNLLAEKKAIIEEKKRQLEEIKNLKNVFKFIVKKNEKNIEYKEYDKKFYLPFIVIVLEKESKAHCETNEERSCFKFTSNKPIKLIEDVDILKELYKLNNDNLNVENNADDIEKFKDRFGGLFDYIS